MTSLAFVFGVMPLLFATGAGAGSRIALGAAVVFGMALNTLPTVYIPNFYELMQKLQEKFSKIGRMSYKLWIMGYRLSHLWLIIHNSFLATC